MVIPTARTGRPYYIATINFRTDRQLELMREFHRACSTFHYREIMALSRAFGITDRTVRAWKYKESFPNWDIALQVIDWVKRGKPMEKVRKRSRVTML